MLYTARYNSPFGELTLASDGKALLGLWIKGQKYFAQSLKEPAEENENIEVFKQTKDWLKRYFSGLKPQITDLPLAPQGTAFSKSVWRILCQIPYGQTTTYGAIAAQLAKEKGLKKMSARAVGGAVGRNPISIIIPCHRVIGSGGALTGYAGGLHIKTALLKHEKAL